MSQIYDLTMALNINPGEEIPRGAGARSFPESIGVVGGDGHDQERLPAVGPHNKTTGNK